LSKKFNKGSAGQNRKAGSQFLEKYLIKEDVHNTGSGLLYRELETAEGQCPQLEDSVTVHQRILNHDSTVIADTYKTGLPDTFSMKEAIPGLREGLLFTSEGSRMEFVIPPELAWGKRGASNKIGPNCVLIFDIRLIEIHPG